MREILDSAPTNDATTLAVNKWGRPWTDGGWRASFRKLIKRLEDAGKVQPGLTFHGLRHTVGTQLAEEGFDTETIKAFLGQKSSRMAEHYTRRANTQRRVEAAVVSIDDQRRNRVKMQNTSQNSGKKEA